MSELLRFDFRGVELCRTAINNPFPRPQICERAPLGALVRSEIDPPTVSGVKAGCSAGCGGPLRGAIDASPPPPPPASLVDAVLRWAGFRREW